MAILIAIGMPAGASEIKVKCVVPENGTTMLLQVPDVRQSTNYSCGASCFQAVVSYWGGKDMGEGQFIELVNTTLGETDRKGTTPSGIVEGAEKMGFRAEIRENLTLDDLRDSINKGVPVIVRLQAWKNADQSWEMNASSHYMVVIGIDSKNVYFEDPWILGNRGYIPHDEFIERWHTFSYASPTADKKTNMIHMGIFISGDKPAQNPGFIHVD
ncbi:C39 family peptidase [Methanosarcina sp. T3]|uniref:C39 family peptidase n=1 Tax=Methanosarcina sp. T3 TaxID=3439062 RepID=UPI003F848ACF